ncbi:hypothetical protein M422DRAFT_49728 [Sphaerobolus stellatus SS14]|uniref:Unplaced genomic scaffold SPHSTscaffold_386, whole genome shotgun sequence n=1 Tax=Sphaerobolus stellatus (strain SS14) TaxID=990650 RepID=A0A0C9U7N3_SPHS4|nr:hypothetical protein M422DRAFT_56284 [Sphaerobolus stellatus SS14]KIJ38983.1 hypothetical protein M422DRAFT_49728 [Sphaerobolus stellatus SS14]
MPEDVGKQLNERTINCNIPQIVISDYDEERYIVGCREKCYGNGGMRCELRRSVLSNAWIVRKKYTDEKLESELMGNLMMVGLARSTTCGGQREDPNLKSNYVVTRFETAEA